jgi:hypothetical protein
MAKGGSQQSHPQLSLAVLTFGRRLAKQSPFRARVRNPEPVALGIALGIAAQFGHDHGEIASMLEGVAHTLVQEGGLQPATPQLWNGRRAGKQRNSLMNAQHSGGARLALKLGQKAQALVAGGRNGAEL